MKIRQSGEVEVVLREMTVHRGFLGGVPLTIGLGRIDAGKR